MRVLLSINIIIVNKLTADTTHMPRNGLNDMPNRKYHRDGINCGEVISNSARLRTSRDTKTSLAYAHFGIFVTVFSFSRFYSTSQSGMNQFQISTRTFRRSLSYLHDRWLLLLLFGHEPRLVKNKRVLESSARENFKKLKIFEELFRARL